MPTTPRRLAAATVIVALALTLTVGCGKAAEKATEELTEKAIEEQGGGNADVDLDADGNVKIETEDGSFSAGSGEIPDGWPEDIELPDGLTIVSGTDLGSGEETISSISATTSSTPAEVVEHFESELEGWESINDSNSSQGGTTTRSAIFTVDDRTFQVAVTADEGEDAFVNLSHSVSPTT